MPGIKMKWVSKEGKIKETRRLLWHLGKQITGSLTDEVRKLFECQLGGALTMFYVDDDGDWITLNKPDELSAAIYSLSYRLSIIVLEASECKDMSPSALQEILKIATVSNHEPFLRSHVNARNAWGNVS